MAEEMKNDEISQEDSITQKTHLRKLKKKTPRNNSITRSIMSGSFAPS